LNNFCQTKKTEIALRNAGIEIDPKTSLLVYYSPL
jgi:hypothetical protein